MKTTRLALLAALCLVLFMVMPGRADDGANPDPLSKITFPLGQLNQEGLMGPPDGLRALNYEFCIPGDAIQRAQVRDIDPTLPGFHAFPGPDRLRPGGSTFASAAPTSRASGRRSPRLASLPFVKRLDQAFFE